MHTYILHMPSARAHVSHAHRPFASCKEGLLLFYYGTGLCQYIAIANEGEVEYSRANGAMDLRSSCGKILRMKLIHGAGRFILYVRLSRT